ncbi:MAG: hypothetical protein GY744_20100 [Gammaproteobacteria bacterium]|nr:hypothetical protein [Gammaproteobacteria bacterium]
MKGNIFFQMKNLFVLIFLFLLTVPGAYAQDLKPIDLQGDWGIEPVHLRVTANGFMIEFRYKVLDAEKALILSDRKEFPYLLSMKSRAKLSVPYGSTVGFLKSNRRFIKKGKNYIAMFSNEGQHMLKGDRVKIQIKNQVSSELVLQ